MIMSVKHIDDYKKIMNYLLFLETHRYPGTDCTSPLQEDPEAEINLKIIVYMSCVTKTASFPCELT